jgi:aminoglycoside phosphotransferase (APT) family kinase protein
MPPDEDNLDPYAILAALGVTDVTGASRAHGGSDTTIWRVQRPDGAYALRVFHAGEERDCERERVVMEAVRAAGLPVPETHAAGMWRGRPALLLTWLPGWPLGEELKRRPWRAWRLGVTFGRAQAAIHALAAPSPLSDHPDAWIDWLGPGHPELAERLRQESHQATALLHLDYHPYNVLTDGERVTGVLDWRNAMAGDPRADAARTSAILRIDYSGRPSMIERALRWLFERAWRAGYEERAGPLGDMSLFFAWAGAVMWRDLASKRPPTDLARIQRWTASQWARASRPRSK